MTWVGNLSTVYPPIYLLHTICTNLYLQTITYSILPNENLCVTGGILNQKQNIGISSEAGYRWISHDEDGVEPFTKEFALIFKQQQNKLTRTHIGILEILKLCVSFCVPVFIFVCVSPNLSLRLSLSLFASVFVYLCLSLSLLPSHYNQCKQEYFLH